MRRETGLASGRMARLVGLLVLAVLSFALRGATAFAQAPTSSGAACGEDVDRWIERCNDGHGAGITGAQCPAPGLFVMETAAARVEVVRDATRGFLRAGAWGVSPVGFNGEWRALPAAMRDAVERVAACVRGDGALPDVRAARGTSDGHEDHTGQGGTDDHEIHGTRTDHEDHTGRGGTDDHEIHGARTDHEDHTGLGGTDDPRDHGGQRGAPRGSSRAQLIVHLPWRLLLAGALLGWLWWPRRNRLKTRRNALVALGFIAAVVALRWAVVGPAFFHQNGQGALWIDAVIMGDRLYGPGFSELFSALFGLAAAWPDRALFLAQSVLAGASIVAAFGLMRRSGVSTEGALPVAAALTAGVALHPTLARVAMSESYFASCLSLELIAAWSLTLAWWPRGDRRAKLRALTPTAAAGLLLSLAVAIHPVAWVPSAAVPLVLLVGPGSARRRLRRTALAYAVVGVVVAVTALPSVLSVLRGQLGQSWGGSAHGSHSYIYPDRILHALTPWLAALVALLIAVRRPVRLVPRALACLAVVATASATDVITPSGARAVISWAFMALHLPVILAVAAAALSDLPRARWQATALGVALAVAGVVFAARCYRASVERPTDARELTALLSWRERLPAGARVGALTRAGRHVLALPLYPSIDPKKRDVVEFHEPERSPPTLAGARTYWYRSSLCSTREGRARCDAIERGLSLEPVATAVLPAIWSLNHLPYDAARIPVGLYRVRGPAAR